MDDYMELHLEVARHYEKESSKKMLKAIQLLYNHTQEDASVLLHSMPPRTFPYATKEQWEEYGREVVMTEASIELPSGKVVYPSVVTKGEEIPMLPNQTPPPEAPDVAFKEIYRWIDGLRRADDIGFASTIMWGGMGGYNITQNKIIVPAMVQREVSLWIYMFGYLAALKKVDVQTIDSEELEEYNGVLQTCIYYLFKKKGYNSGDYGLGLIMFNLDKFEKYLDAQPEIEELLDYFHPLD